MAVLGGNTTYKGLGRAFNITERTVQSHICNVFDKMKLDERNLLSVILTFLGYID